MSPEALIAIAGMALVTFGIRVGGLLLADRLPETGFVAAWLRFIPGAVLAALVAPVIAEGGPAELAASLATALAFVLTRNLIAAMAAGIGIVVAARLLLGA